MKKQTVILVGFNLFYYNHYNAIVFDIGTIVLNDSNAPMIQSKLDL